MQIKNMFKDDINRKINGVVKVDQDATDVIAQEVREYVITRDLKKHFITFFKNYSESFKEPISDIGVWISGFFGSGKSHFLKMLSYVLENKEIDGISTVERFEEKLEDNRDIYEMMRASTQNTTDTILFNIDIIGPKNKNNTAVLQSFAKMFYNHCGYYGENLKVALMEQYVDGEGKFEEFKASFLKHKGKTWEDQRRAFAFNGAAVKAALVEVLGMSEEDANAWFSNKKDEDFSIETLVKDIKAYVDKKPAGYRLMFMADEVGQYTGGDTSLLLNLQSLVEEIGSVCEGKVWVICTGQEAIDEIIKARENEFSRIQARFKTRLSLTSSSVDEVIQERILKKKPEVEAAVKNVYAGNEAVMRNLFSFTNSVLDIKGYGSANEFCKNFPFVPYQFIIIQKVFTEIRKHGNAGKHLAGGERSMLSGFQEAAQKIQEKDEFSIAPFYLFYDTVHTFLDSSIRKVIDRAQKAAEEGLGLAREDVDLLKLLYLVRYVDDIPSNIDNLIIMMADDIRIDKIDMRENIRKSLDRLVKENYIARTGETYNFMTDEEQDVEREIKNTIIDTANIISKIGNLIFADIYTTKKFRYDKYDFAFDQYVDGTAVQNGSNGVELKILSVDTYGADRSDEKLIIDSKGRAIVALAETPYYENLENAMKIRKYVKQKNVSTLPITMQTIIRNKQDEANQLEAASKEQLKKAIEEAKFYVDGDKVIIGSGDAKGKIDQAMKCLVERVYNCLGMITKFADTDMDIMSVLAGKQTSLEGMHPNQQALDKVREYLEMQSRLNMPTSMEDIQRRYQKVPYGWKEIDIAAVVAQLMVDQKVDVKYAGEGIAIDNPKLPEMLRKKSEIGRTQVSIHKTASAAIIRNAKELMSEYFDCMDVPGDEKGLVSFIISKFDEQKVHYETLLKKYEGDIKYPDYNLLREGYGLTTTILNEKKDTIALLGMIVKKEEDLLDSREDLSQLEDFFKTQVALFEQASRFVADMKTDLDYLNGKSDAKTSLDTIRAIVLIPSSGKYNYKRIPELNGLMSIVKDYHNQLVEDKRKDLLEELRQCMEDVHVEADDDIRLKPIVVNTDASFDNKKQAIEECTCLALLDGIRTQLWNIRDNAVNSLQNMKNTISQDTKQPVEGPESTPIAKQVIKSYPRGSIFTTTMISSSEDVDTYVENIRKKLLTLLDSCDGIKLN